jgi:hypothetical protein
MIESVEQARELVDQASDQPERNWQDLYYVASYLRGRGEDPFVDSVWRELESAQEERVSLPPQVAHRLRAQLEQKLYAQWQAVHDSAVMLKEAGYDPFSMQGWQDLLAAKEAKDLDTLALTTHYLQPSVTRTRSLVIQELTQVSKMLRDQGDDPLSADEWERLLAPEKTPEEEEALIQMLMPRVTDTLHTCLQKLDLTAQQFQAAGYAPFISDWKRLRQALERRTLRELTSALRIFPSELEEHVRLRLPYWSDRTAQMEPLQEQLELPKNRTQAKDLIAAYQTGLAKLKSLDRKGSYTLDSLHAMVLAIAEVESSWQDLMALSRSEERLAKRLRWAIGGIVIVFLALVVAAAAWAPRLVQVNEPTPLLGIPPSVLLWSFIGSFVALLMRFIRRKFWEIGDFFKWFLARSLVGFVMGAILYLVVVSGSLVLGIVIGSPSGALNTLPRPEIFWLLAFFGASNDRIAERVLSAVTGGGIRLFEPAAELEREETNEPATEPDEKGEDQDV